MNKENKEINNNIPKQLNFSFNTGNDVNDKKNPINENDQKAKEDNNKNETQLTKNDINETVQTKFKLPVLISKEDINDKKIEKENKALKEIKKEDNKFNLFSSKDPRIDIFGKSPKTNKTNPIFYNFNPIGDNTANIENKKEEKTVSNKMEEIPKLELFTGSNTNNKEIFSSNNPKSNETVFFGIGTNTSKQKDQKFNNTPKKEGLFSQQTSVSSSINPNNLFTSNKPEEKSKEDPLKNNPFFSKIENKTFNIFTDNQPSNDKPFQNNQIFSNNQGKGNIFTTQNSIFSSSNTSSTFMPSKYGNDQGSLLSQNNPFLNNKTISNTTNIFGNNKNLQNNPTQSIFGSLPKGSLFGN